MKRVNLLDYFELAEMITNARRATSFDKSKGGSIWVGTSSVSDSLKAFCQDDNGFSTCKHAAKRLYESIDNWFLMHLKFDSLTRIRTENFDTEFDSWTYNHIRSNIDYFRNVFEAECRDVDVYSVGEMSIYKTSALVSNGSAIIPQNLHEIIPAETLDELNNAGRCLAFDLPTACGFHALRSLEIVMDLYLTSFEVNTRQLRSWSDYIKAMQKLIERKDSDVRPPAKVVAMLDRMRELDRNPLMHPRDNLDQVQADILFKLCAITIVELARDISHRARNQKLALASSQSADAVNESATKRALKIKQGDPGAQDRPEGQ